MSDFDTTLIHRGAGLSQADMKYMLSARLNAYILEIFCYAAYSVVYMLAVYLMVLNVKGKLTPQRKALAGVITVLWAVLTIRVGYVWHLVIAIYIEHGASREGALTYIPPNALEAIVSISFYTLILLADLIMIWRTWAMYARSWLAIVLPMLTMLTGLFAVGVELTIEFIPSAFDSGSIGVGLLFIDWISINFSMIVCTNTLCTVLIISRIIFLIGWHHALRTYGSIINILVESAFVYSGVFIIYIALFNSVDASNEKNIGAAYSYVYALLPSITCFAPTLVILRVASGHAVTNTSVMPSTGVSAPIQFADRTPDVDVESNAGM